MRDECELFSVETLPWQPVGAVLQKVLSRGTDGVTLTRLARWPRGLDTSEDGVIRHTYHEEVYLLEGYLTDLTLGQTFGPGCYTSRRPGMPHGPYRTDTRPPLRNRQIRSLVTVGSCAYTTRQASLP
jgi:hypothetical protein